MAGSADEGYLATGEDGARDKEAKESNILQSIQQNFNEEEAKEAEETIKRLLQREEPVNILVIGPTGVGKSTLINALLGNAVAKAKAGASSVQSEVTVHEGAYEGIKIRVYDTTGFSDTKGKSGDSIVKEIAKANKFDLILICVRMDNRADEKVKDMFTVLGENLRREMWERSIIVLTFANMYLQLGSVKKSPKNKAEIIRSEIKDFKGHVHKFLSPTLKKETIDEIPFCIAGDDEEQKLPTTHNWLKELWDKCLLRCSDEARGFLSVIAKYRLLIEAGALSGATAVGVAVGVAVGAVGGSVVPVAGTIAGGILGAGVGGGLAAVITVIVLAVKRKYKKKQVKQNSSPEQKT